MIIFPPELFLTFKSAEPKLANELYESFIEEVKTYDIKTQTGKFAAMMDVSLINDGPVTFMIDIQ